jgi:hypothetical protein
VRQGLNAHRNGWSGRRGAGESDPALGQGFVWWAVGDLSVRPGSDRLDYLVRPPQLPASAELAVGLAAAVLVVLTAVVVLAPASTLRHDARWWSVLGPLVVGGAFAGVSWRIVTAGNYGANIGGGLLLLIAAPLTVALVVWTVARSVQLLREPRRAHR